MSDYMRHCFPIGYIENTGDCSEPYDDFGYGGRGGYIRTPDYRGYEHYYRGDDCHCDFHGHYAVFGLYGNVWRCCVHHFDLDINDYLRGSNHQFTLSHDDCNFIEIPIVENYDVDTQMLDEVLSYFESYVDMKDKKKTPDQLRLDLIEVLRKKCLKFGKIFPELTQLISSISYMVVTHYVTSKMPVEQKPNPHFGKKKKAT